MLIPPGLRVFFAVEPVDMRGSFYALSNHVRAALREDPRAGHLFVFLGKRRNLVKLLFWDRSGWCILAKRLEVGRFSFPVDIAHDVAQVEVDFATLTMLLEGIDLRGATRRKAFEAPTFVK
jgi:transposase